jgi:hypothetical protein
MDETYVKVRGEWFTSTVQSTKRARQWTSWSRQQDINAASAQGEGAARTSKVTLDAYAASHVRGGF